MWRFRKSIAEQRISRRPARPMSGGCAAPRFPMRTGSWRACGEILRDSANHAARSLKQAPTRPDVATTGRGLTTASIGPDLTIATIGRGLTTTTNRATHRYGYVRLTDAAGKAAVSPNSKAALPARVTQSGGAGKLQRVPEQIPREVPGYTRDPVKLN
jgi:hypothetical protein